jgi:hypothetical protein
MDTLISHQLGEIPAEHLERGGMARPQRLERSRVPGLPTPGSWSGAGSRMKWRLLGAEYAENPAVEAPGSAWATPDVVEAGRWAH